jgi:uncharacterized membrane protein YdfJ with MMPL/SSD domain
LSVTLSFSIMLPVSRAIDVSSVTPSLMISCVVAMSTDYTLFMFSRFGEEMRANEDSRLAITNAMLTAGETILISGTTLCICFLGLTLLPLTFLQTMGLGAGCAVLACVLVSLSFVPAFVFSLPRYFSSAMTNDFATLYHWAKRRCSPPPADDSETRPMSFFTAVQPSRVEHVLSSRWYRLANWTIKHRYAVTAVLLLSMVPMIVVALRMTTSMEVVLSVPRGVESAKAYTRLGDQFGAGRISPYTLVLVPSDADAKEGVFTTAFFNESHEVIRNMMQHTPIEAFNGLVVFNGSFVSRDEWYSNLTSGTGEFADTMRAFTVMFSNVDKDLDLTTATAQTVLVTLDFSPFSDKGKHWLVNVRNDIKRSNSKLQVYLANGAGDVIDGIDLVYDFLPIEMCVTAAVVFLIMAISFRSLVVPIRSLLALSLTLSWTYGVATLVYNYGILDWLGWDAVSKYDGISWFTPVMCFSILTGFGLDYDCFILTRIVEYRTNAYTEHASIKLALYKTGSIITAAGMIMAIAFGGLLFSTMPLLNMCAFFMAFSVLFDTFVVRSLLVPATMGIFNNWNFWPRKLPPPVKDETCEESSSDVLLPE